MDIDLLRTFLEVNRSRHFGRAAQNLFLSQSAVSARIRLLEDTVGAPVFTRTRNNIQLTPTGQRLLRHAETIVNSWNRARQELAVQDESDIPLAVGGVPSLWDILLQDWLHRVHRRLPDIVLRAEVHDQDNLLRRLLAGTTDVGFMFEAPQLEQWVVHEIARVPLVLVTSRPHQQPEQALRDGYVLVDWGSSFANAHARHFPDMPPPRLRMSLGRMARAFLLECGGAAYLAAPMVGEELAAGRLYTVEGAPVIDRVAYAALAADSDKREVIEQSLALFAEEVGTGQAPGLPRRK